MYEVFKNVILGGDYDLTALKQRINTAWAGSKISDAEREELNRLAEQGAKPENSYASADRLVEQALKRIADLEERVAALEGGSSDGEPVEYPDWRQPTGAHDAYHNGDKMTYTDGKQYVCIAPEGVAVVWAPDVMPSYWQVVA